MMKNKIISLNSDGKLYYRQAMKKKHQKQYANALNLLEKSLKQDSENREYISEYTYVLTLLGRYDEAEQFILNEFQAANFDTSYFYELSKMNVLIEDPNKALLFGMMYVELYDDEALYEALLDMFTFDHYDYEELLEEAEHFTGQYIFQTYFMAGQIETSLNFLDSLQVDVRESKEFLNMRGMALLFLNRFDEAEVILSDLLSDDQTDMHALSHLTLLYFYTNQMDKYHKFITHLETVEPLDEDDRLKVGLVLNFLSKYDMAYQLLYPLYKKKYMVNFQLLHALSQSAYYSNREQEARMYWDEMQLYHPLDDIHSPWAREQARHELNRMIDKYLGSDDSHMRILGLFKISILRPEDIIFGSPLFDLIEGFGDFEKVYTAFLFNHFKHTRFQRLHSGLELLSIDYLNDDDVLLGWIDEVTKLEKKQLMKDKSGEIYALAYLFVYHNFDDRMTIESLSEQFQIYKHKIKQAVDVVKQNG